MSDQKTTTPRVRATKNKAQRKAAAEASRRHRAKRSGEGVPTAAQVDAALVSMLMWYMVRPAGILLKPKYIPAMCERLIRAAGWDGESDAVCVAVSGRVKALSDRALPHMDAIARKVRPKSQDRDTAADVASDQEGMA